MKFTIAQPALLNVLQTASKAVAVRTTKQVLTGILLQAEAGRLIATAYDLELGIRVEVPADDVNMLSVQEPGAIVLSARYLADVVRKLPNREVSVGVGSNYMTEIRCGEVEFHLHGIDAAEFPLLPVFQSSQSLQVTSEHVRELVRATAFASATSEVRPILTGVHVELGTGRLQFTATDGLRLATRWIGSAEAGESAWNVIIPSKSLVELAKILPDDDVPVQLYVSDSHSLFVVGTTHFYTRLIEGTYPDTTRIIPSTHRTEVAIDADLMADAVDRAALIARDRENHMVRFEISGTSIQVSSSSSEIGNVSERIQANRMEGDDLSIAFNARYVLEALRALAADEVVLQFNGPNQPFTIRESGAENGLQLISPILWR
ncbi:DNA polymerase III subunit beta [Alicyclobacillus macrosporangiidus]|jgi:DNA polymerase-3 subunit beta|uniref:Beta sliding clamp n=1 Tax=Alicyclobacillus macrosporangiidus TaxID=392015 RepID=A0A1I7HN58_9BACL|nr:DNA polymerase III subunit beta [Alicyclobacillus macrosporangiidus]SFU62132.1 DNA polymerase-3 subunit beta [Alicyclobacillus macrosporangiidus]